MSTENTNEAAQHISTAEAFTQKIKTKTGKELALLERNGRYSCVRFFNEYHAELVDYCKSLAKEESISLSAFFDKVREYAAVNKESYSDEKILDAYIENNTEGEDYDDMVWWLILYLMEDAAVSADQNTDASQ